MRETTINSGYNELQYVEYMYIHTNHVDMDTSSKPRIKSIMSIKKNIYKNKN